MKRIRIEKPKPRREDSSPEVQSLDPRDPEVCRAVALARDAAAKEAART